jgi:hypothetical protein
MLPTHRPPTHRGEMLLKEFSAAPRSCSRRSAYVTRAYSVSHW